MAEPISAGPALTTLLWTACPADREDLRLAQREFVGLPLPLLAQLLAATALCLAGGLRASGEFRPVALADNPR